MLPHCFPMIIWYIYTKDYTVKSHSNSYNQDHVRQKEISSEDKPAVPSGSLEKERVAVLAAVTAYTQSQFCEGTTVCSVHNKGDELVVVLSGQKTNLRNYWSGKWRSEWKVLPGKTTIAGMVHVLIHYFEDGNVQMDTKKDLKATKISFKDPKSLGEAVVKVCMIVLGVDVICT